MLLIIYTKLIEVMKGDTYFFDWFCSFSSESHRKEYTTVLAQNKSSYKKKPEIKIIISGILFF